MTDGKQRCAGSTSTETLDNLSARRGYVRQKITKLHTKVNENRITWSKQEIAMHLLKCKDLHVEITSLDEEIFSICISLKMSEAELSERSSSDENYTDALHSITSILETPVLEHEDAMNHTYDPSVPHVGGTFSTTKMKLPQVQFPAFGNNTGENLGTFLKSFEAIIEKHRLSSYEKFVYLQKQLSNAPKVLIDSLDISQHSYENAKDLLQQAFDSTEKSKYDIIHTLANLNLPLHEQPYNYIGKMRTIVSAITALDITVDDIVNYFVWKGFNRDFQGHLTNITNKCNPNLEEINNCIFEAAERYNKQLKLSKNVDEKINKTFKPKEANAMAVNINEKPKIFCVLCSADKNPNDHQLRNCTVYETPRNKFDKLRKIKACVLCSFANHDSNNCKFQFKSNCRNCDGSHMTFLCLKPPRPGVSSNAVASSHPVNEHFQEITNNVSCIEDVKSSSQNSIILPTFTARITSNENDIPVRVFKDSGCQTTLICGALAASLNLPVVRENVPLVIHGFNSSRKLRTKIVRFNLKLGENNFSHDAVCIEKIRTNFRVDGIGEVVAAFEQSGYTLADTSYSSGTSGIVNDIDLILGTDADHMLPISYRTYGNASNPDCMSSFIETPIGIVLSGSMQKMTKNLPFLPNKIEKNSDKASIIHPHISPPNTIQPIATKHPVKSKFISTSWSKNTFCTSQIVPSPNQVEPRKNIAVPRQNLSGTLAVKVPNDISCAPVQSRFLLPPGEVDANDQLVKPFIRRKPFLIRPKSNARKRLGRLEKQCSV